MTANPVSVELQQLSVLTIKHVDQNECGALNTSWNKTPFLAIYISIYVAFVTATTIQIKLSNKFENIL